MQSENRRFSRWLLSLPAVALVTLTGLGCSTAGLTAQGLRVVAVYETPPNCQVLGMVTGQGGGSFGGGWISNDRLIEYAMNDLRNKAAAMGATHVQASPPQLGQSEGTTSTATVIGTAYRCPH